jgi:hypothetical protein
MFVRVSDALRRRPMLFACASATTQTFCADVLVQTSLEQRSVAQLDLHRTAAFTLFGAGWVGCGQYVLFCKVFEALVPSATAAASVGKMALDQFLHVPLLYFPIYFSVDAWIQGKVAAGEGFAHVQHKFDTELFELLKVNWSIWVPASFVGFRFMPTHLRIPYVSCVSFCWNCIFSRMQGRFRHRAPETRESERH